MQNFSDTQKSSREQIVESVCERSGLSKKSVDLLFNGYLSQGQSLSQINESFEQFLTPKSLSTNEFFDMLKKNAEKLGRTLSLDDKQQITNELLFSIKNSADSTDAVNLLKIVANILKVKNPKKFIDSFNQNDLLEDIDLTKLNEGFDISENATINQETTVKLYEGLREILYKNNPRFGVTYHLSNTYESIMRFLSDEIEQLTVAGEIQTHDESMHERYIVNLLRGNIPQYQQNIDYIRTQIPDIQTLVFDLMCIVHQKMNYEQRTMQYLSVEKYNQYLNSVEALFGATLSSIRNSYVIDKEWIERIYKDHKEDPTINPKIFVFEEMTINWGKLGFSYYTLTSQTAFEALNIIRSCSVDFNLNTRAILKNYHTAAFNLMRGAEKIILEKSKVNKYKDSY